MSLRLQAGFSTNFNNHCPKDYSNHNSAFKEEGLVGSLNFEIPDSIHNSAINSNYPIGILADSSLKVSVDTIEDYTSLN
jgi:hypothetical protein